MTPTVTEMITTLMGYVSTVFGKVLEMIGALLNIIINQPILIIFCVALPLVGISVGMLRRILSTRG